MSIVSRSASKIFTSILLRKFLHLLFSLILLIPFTQQFKLMMLKVLPFYADPTLLILSVLLFGAGIINSIQIRMPDLKERFLKLSSDFRRKILEGLEGNSKGRAYADLVDGFLTSMIKYEEKLLELVSMVERDYEVKYGYICITFGLLSITMSYALFKNWAIYGVLALAVVDSVSSIATYFTHGRRKILKHSDISIALTFILFTLFLHPLTQDLVKALIISFSATLTELISPEDNLTLPIVTSLVAYILQAHEPLI